LHSAPDTQHGQIAYRRWIDRFGTYACRLAGPWFRDILWRVTSGAAKRFQLPVPAERTLYLTFDDGPTDRGTPALMEVLARHGVPATFFLVGENCQKHPQRVREMVQAGHALGNHTRTHLDPWRTLFPALADELLWTQNVVEGISGAGLHWIRPPHGHVTNKLRAWCDAQQLPIVMWDVLPADFAPWCTPDSVARFVARYVRPGSIIVLHDNALTIDRTPFTLELLLSELRAEGWQFAALPTERRFQANRFQAHRSAA